MKVFLERTIEQESMDLDEVRCNQCGHEITRNVFGYFEDHLSVSKTWGYGTAADGKTHAFDLCFDCYSELVEKFRIPPEFRKLPEPGYIEFDDDDNVLANFQKAETAI